MKCLHELLRSVKLQVIERGSTGYSQATLTVPKDFLSYLEWAKGEELEAVIILGSDQLIVRRKRKGFRGVL